LISFESPCKFVLLSTLPGNVRGSLIGCPLPRILLICTLVIQQREDNPFLNDNVTNRSINQNMSQGDFSENMKIDKGIPLSKGLQNMPFNFMESSPVTYSDLLICL
jgi:hypothetical protein